MPNNSWEAKVPVPRQYYERLYFVKLQKIKVFNPLSPETIYPQTLKCRDSLFFTTLSKQH
jgi:hypothetical protein